MCGSKGPKDLAGEELRAAVAEFAEALKPHIAAAEKHGTRISIENHGNALIETPDSMKWFIEYTRSPHHQTTGNNNRLASHLGRI